MSFKDWLGATPHDAAVIAARKPNPNFWHYLSSEMELLAWKRSFENDGVIQTDQRLISIWNDRWMQLTTWQDETPKNVQQITSWSSESRGHATNAMKIYRNCLYCTFIIAVDTDLAGICGRLEIMSKCEPLWDDSLVLSVTTVFSPCAQADSASGTWHHDRKTSESD